MKVWSGGCFTEIFFFTKIIVLGIKHLKLVPRIMVHGCFTWADNLIHNHEKVLCRTIQKSWLQAGEPNFMAGGPN